jgi:hypothetical protein
MGPNGRPGNLVPSHLVRSALHGDRAILLDLQSERYYGLDEVGTRMWALLTAGLDPPAIVAKLAAEYEVPPPRLQADLGRILDQLLALGMVLPASARAQPEPVPQAGTGKCAAQGTLRRPSGLVCGLALVFSVLTLRCFGLRRSLSVAGRLGRRPPAPQRPSPEFLARVVRSIDTAAAFFPGRALCLEQSLALYTCLRYAGVPATLRIGVQPYPFAAHAWVEYGGDPVGDGHDRVGKFVPFDDLGVA